MRKIARTVIASKLVAMLLEYRRQTDPPLPRHLLDSVLARN